MVASGNVTHNLHNWQRAIRTDEPAPAYGQAFADWVHERTIARDTAAPLAYRTLHPAGARAHPTNLQGRVRFSVRCGRGAAWSWPALSRKPPQCGL
jgi:aromatic ring-opening dioxygenase catalytic subunit (LigB family)